MNLERKNILLACDYCSWRCWPGGSVSPPPFRRGSEDLKLLRERWRRPGPAGTERPADSRDWPAGGGGCPLGGRFYRLPRNRLAELVATLDRLTAESGLSAGNAHRRLPAGEWEKVGVTISGRGVRRGGRILIGLCRKKRLSWWRRSI